MLDTTVIDAIHGEVRAAPLLVACLVGLWLGIPNYLPVSLYTMSKGVGVVVSSAQ